MKTVESDFGPISITRKARAKNMRLSLDPTTGAARLTLPWRVSEAEGLSFVEQHRGWIETHRQKLLPARPFQPGDLLPLLGRERLLLHDRALKGLGHVTDTSLTVGGDLSFFNRRIKELIKAEATRCFEAEAQKFAQALGVTLKHVQIKDTTSRWGSCSAQGLINLSWRLAFAPASVYSYVIAHEVAHRVEMNHSPRFWSVVSTLCQNAQEARAWLKRHGPRLMSYGQTTPQSNLPRSPLSE